MDLEVLEKLQNFTLSGVETQGIDLDEGDVKIGMAEGNRSLIGKVYGEKRANFLGIKSSMLKLWQNRGISKVVALPQGLFQFVFNKEADRESIMQRPVVL